MAIGHSTIQVNGEPVDVEVTELSFGCSEHSAPTCLLLRRLDNGDTLHIPGGGYAVHPH